MSDGVGTTTFTYTPAGQLASESGPWNADTVSYVYSDRLRVGMDLQQPNASERVSSECQFSLFKLVDSNGDLRQVLDEKFKK